MPEPSIHDILSKNFPISGKDEWMRLASQEAPDKNVENLIWQIGGLKFNPYYVKADLRDIKYLKDFHASSYSNGASWLNMPQITVIEEQSANKKALEYLGAGADGILFDLSDRNDFDIKNLLKEIDWNYCALSFIISDTKIATKIFAFAEQKNYDPSRLNGSVFWKSLPETKKLTSFVKPGFGEYQFFGIGVPPSTAVQEISKSLQQAVRLMDEMTDMGMDREIVFRSVSLSFPCSENFFITIAKLKAVRILWYQLSQSFKVLRYYPADLCIHCRSTRQIDEKYQPHGGMIQNTLQALAAILGGCNALTLCSEEPESSMTPRVALNVSNILKEESHLDKVADPTVGSYALENIVHEISQAAWNDFQNNLQS